MVYIVTCMYLLDLLRKKCETSSTMQKHLFDCTSVTNLELDVKQKKAKATVYTGPLIVIEVGAKGSDPL